MDTERLSPSPTITIQSTAPSTAPSLGDMPCRQFSTSEDVFKAADATFRNGDDILAITGIFNSLLHYYSLLTIDK